MQPVKGLLFYSLFFISVIAASAVHAQETYRIAMEETINDYLGQIKTSSKDTTIEAKKSLWGANISLMSYMKEICKQHPSVIGEEFRTVGDIDGQMYGMNIVSSEDKAMRIYCWDTWTSTEKHRFNTLVQYRVGNDVEIAKWSDVAEHRGKIGMALNCFSEITIVQDNNNKPIYLVMSFSIDQGNEGGHEVQAYRIDSTLVPVSVFSYYGELKHSLRVTNDRTVNGKMSEDDTNIKISADGRFIYVPLIRSANATKESQANKKSYNVYQFNGSEFVYKENLNN